MHVETVIVGAGQAGLALSRSLTAAGRPHVVLERGRVGERWRSERWESLRLLTPNWLNRLPGAPALPDPDGYLDRRGVVEHLEAYAAGAPVHERTTVLGVRRSRRAHLVVTDAGDWHARNVVIATGDCDVPRVPAIAADAPPFLHQLHATGYRRPARLPEGGVLVVGAGPSGQQIAAELRRAGRDVVLAAGRHARMPRTYRGRDVFAWLHATGQLDDHVDHVPDLAAARRAPSFPVSGANGGESLGLDRLAALGVAVTGRLEGFAGDHALFADTLPRDVARRRPPPAPLAGAVRRLHLARARRRAGGRPAAGGRDRRRSAPPGPPRARLHGALGHGLPPHLPVARRARPRRATASSCTGRASRPCPASSRWDCGSSAPAGRTSSAAWATTRR